MLDQRISVVHFVLHEYNIVGYIDITWTSILIGVL